MTRVGKYTGKIYPKDYPLGNIPECCINVPDDIAEEAAKQLEGNKCRDTCCPGGCPANLEDPR